MQQNKEMNGPKGYRLSIEGFPEGFRNMPLLKALLEEPAYKICVLWPEQSFFVCLSQH